jgi:methanogenic corrinoid protein MtbC1
MNNHDIEKVESDADGCEEKTVGHTILAQNDSIAEKLKEQKSFIDLPSTHGDLAAQYLNAVLSLDSRRACELILSRFEKGMCIKDIYLHVLQPVQYEVGLLWHTRKISVAQEHFTSAVTQLVMSQLYPHICGTEKGNRKLVATCVSGELHEIGIKMVADFFEMEGWNTYFLGANMPANDIIETLLTHKVDVLAISTSIPSNVVKTEALISKVRSSEVRDTKILVGGYAFNSAPSLRSRVGADNYADSAPAALTIAHQCVAGVVEEK